MIAEAFENLQCVTKVLDYLDENKFTYQVLALKLENSY
jgi:hypothetical protein